ncbi:hypothetical protein D3C78_1158370 [compost metagenome]
MSSGHLVGYVMVSVSHLLKAIQGLIGYLIGHAVECRAFRLSTLQSFIDRLWGNTVHTAIRSLISLYRYFGIIFMGRLDGVTHAKTI